MSLPVEGGSVLSENLVGAHFADYDSYLVLSHFKGHAMAGFGGAIKNISIGLGSAEGKCLIHTGGKSHTSPWAATRRRSPSPWRRPANLCPTTWAVGNASSISTS